MCIDPILGTSSQLYGTVLYATTSIKNNKKSCSAFQMNLYNHEGKISLCVGQAHTGLPVMLLHGYQMYLEDKQLYTLSESHLLDEL